MESDHDCWLHDSSSEAPVRRRFGGAATLGPDEKRPASAGRLCRQDSPVVGVARIRRERRRNRRGGGKRALEDAGAGRFRRGGLLLSASSSQVFQVGSLWFSPRLGGASQRFGLAVGFGGRLGCGRLAVIPPRFGQLIGRRFSPRSSAVGFFRLGCRAMVMVSSWFFSSLVSSQGRRMGPGCLF